MNNIRIQIERSIYRMRTPPDVEFRQGGAQPGTKEKIETKRVSEDKNQLLCRQCLFAITDAANRISVNGAHNHAFANPHGVVFEIGCFRNASGCGIVGRQTNEFSWFSGYLWQVAVCSSCLLHVGWRFAGTNRGSFYGLIHDRLVETTTSGS